MNPLGWLQALISIHQAWKSGEKLHVDILFGPHGFQGSVVNRSRDAQVVLTQIDFTADWRGKKLRTRTRPIEVALEPNEKFRLRMEDQNSHIWMPPRRPPKWAIAQTRRGHCFRGLITHQHRVFFKKQNRRCRRCGGKYWLDDLYYQETVMRNPTGQIESSRYDLVCARCYEDGGPKTLSEVVRRINEQYRIKCVRWRLLGG